MLNPAAHTVSPSAEHWNAHLTTSGTSSGTPRISYMNVEYDGLSTAHIGKPSGVTMTLNGEPKIWISWARWYKMIKIDVCSTAADIGNILFTLFVIRYVVETMNRYNWWRRIWSVDSNNYDHQLIPVAVL